MPEKYKLVYKTSTTPFFPLCLIGKNYAGFSGEKIFGLPLILPGVVVCVIDNGTVNWFLSEKCESVSIKLLDEFFSDPKYLNNLCKKEKELAQKLILTASFNPEKLFIENTLNHQGEVKLKRIFRLYSDYGCVTDMAGMLFQTYYADIVKKEFFVALKGTSNQKKERYFSLIFSSPQETHYERFLFKLYEHILSKKDNKNLGKIAQAFYWVIYDYLGEIINIKYLEKEVQRLKEKPQIEMEKEIEETKERIRKIKQLEKKLPQRIVQKVKITQGILYLYNERKKEVLNKINILLRKVIECKFPNKRLSELHKIYQLAPEEIIKLLQGGEIRVIAEREERWVYTLTTNKIRQGSERYFKLIEPSKTKKALTGTPASIGKAQGKVNVVLNVSQIPKFQEGNILVAPFTNVNYLPVMRKAKAILTETGGLTSHAAIVARELKKPCIVGIKDLIAVLKDGDIIEVDADKGIVKILK